MSIVQISQEILFRTTRLQLRVLRLELFDDLSQFTCLTLILLSLVVARLGQIDDQRFFLVDQIRENLNLMLNRLQTFFQRIEF